MASSTSPTFSVVSLHDIDQYSEWAAELGWDTTSTQLSPGLNRIGINYFAAPGLIVSHFQARQSMKNTFALPEGWVTLAICRRKVPAVWCGMQFPPSLLAVMRATTTHWAVLPAHWDSYEFMVSEELIQRTELFPPGFFKKTARVEEAYVPLVEPQTERFLDRLDRLFREFRVAKDALAAAITQGEFHDLAINGLQGIIDAGLAAANGSVLKNPARRADLVPKAREFMTAHLSTDLTADEIAQALGVSYRVLNYAFRSSVGVSPYRYFLTEKLHAARRQLKASEFSVIEALVANGFTTPSRFTRQYKRLFGELPSETRLRGMRKP
jgi:AraC family ethanolamine operon transcriptional activator